MGLLERIPADARRRRPRRRRLAAGSLSVSVGSWDRVAGLASIVVSGAHDPRSAEALTPAVIHGWIDKLAAWGYTGARTNALSQPLALVFERAGFDMAQDLCLLERASGSVPNGTDRTRRDIVAVNPWRAFGAVRRGTCAEILRIDEAAFPSAWALDSSSLKDALGATPVTRVFLSRNGPLTDGFIVLGVSDDVAYVQRLAVDPGRRRSGIARQLMSSAMNWAREAGARRVMVNTEVSNIAALGLYRSLGFAALPQGLCVMHRDLR